jgi:hypothetical protein
VDCPRVGSDYPAFKAVKHEVKKQVLDSVKNTSADCPEARIPKTPERKSF